VPLATEIISARQINNRGIGWANKQIFRRLIKKTEADKYIIDGRIRIGRVAGKTGRIKSVVDADATIPAVILAGIVAKVERDKIMRTLHKQFRRYRWNNSKGYGTKKHLEALQKYGMCRYHRSVFVTTALR
jgi:ribonuclease HII